MQAFHEISGILLTDLTSQHDGIRRTNFHRFFFGLFFSRLRLGSRHDLLWRTRRDVFRHNSFQQFRVELGIGHRELRIARLLREQCDDQRGDASRSDVANRGIFDENAVFPMHRNGFRKRFTLVFLSRRLSEFAHFKRVQSIERRRQNTCLVGRKFVATVSSEADGAQIVELKLAFFGQNLLQFLDFGGNSAQSLGITDVVGFDIRLRQQRVVQPKLGIETERAQRRQENTFRLLIAGTQVMRHKTAEIRHNDAIVLQQKDFNMLF